MGSSNSSGHMTDLRFESRTHPQSHNRTLISRSLVAGGGSLCLKLMRLLWESLKGTPEVSICHKLYQIYKVVTPPAMLVFHFLPKAVPNHRFLYP